jgi:hypothetical protein
MIGGYPNRFGKDACTALARSFRQKEILLNHLNLSGVSMGTDDFLKIVDGLIESEYRLLETLDVSNNRI